MKFRLSLLFALFVYSIGYAQQQEKWTLYGDIRLAYIGSSTDAHGFGGENTLLRVRPGISYTMDSNQSFSARLVYLVSQNAEPVKFTIAANGNGALAYGSLSFDEFYYRFQNDKTDFKIGRFQFSTSVLSNARRSHLLFPSNGNFVHWSDGVYFKRMLNQEWYGEAFLEYQHRGDISYPYKSPLFFQDNEHNLIVYLGAENRKRDALNTIQKGFGVLYVPKFGRDYVALDSRIAIDFPKEELLNGGSIRIVGELGHTVTAEDFKDGLSMVASVGVNGVGGKQEFMIEFAKTGAEWLTATPFAPAADEVEFRYRYFFSKKVNVDFRYLMRDFRSNTLPNAYSTFARIVYIL